MSMTALLLTFAAMTQSYKLPEGLLSALCFVESSHRVNAIHNDDGKGNSVGVCQIKLTTAKMMGFTGTEEELRAPKTNIQWSAKYLQNQITRYSGNVRKAVSAYNMGSYKERNGVVINKKYVDKVFKAWGEGR